VGYELLSFATSEVSPPIIVFEIDKVKMFIERMLWEDE
jgi:hypothetical protein